MAAVSYPTEGNEVCFQIEDQSFWFSHRNACILAALNCFPPAGAIYDVGGGNGYVAKAIQDSGYNAVLVEPGEDGIRNARSRGVKRALQGTLESAGLRSGSVAAIGIFDVLEHIEKQADFLETIHTNLAPGGRLYLTVPAHQWLWSHEDIEAGHYRRYGLRSLCAELRQAGYRVQYSSYFFSFLPPLIYALRTLPHRLGCARESSLKSPQRDHPATPAPVKPILRWELSRIRRGARIPFGASCLIVAER